jgi:hypothetical protein
MNSIVHYIGLDVHKETIAVSIAPQHSVEVRRYDVINGSLDAVEQLVKRLSQPGVRLHFIYEAGPCGFVLCRYLRSQGILCDLVCPSLIPKKASDRVITGSGRSIVHFSSSSLVTPINVAPNNYSETMQYCGLTPLGADMGRSRNSPYYAFAIFVE